MLFKGLSIFTKMSLIGLCGFAGAGKDTVGAYLVSEHGYVKVAFADPLKDVVSSIFGWDRAMMDGVTPEDRKFRETVDQWWTEAVGKTITPRNQMQLWGTDIGRKMFHPKLWILAVRRKVEKLLEEGKKVVVTDCRFVDECEIVRELGGKLCRIHREYPLWYDIALYTPELMFIKHPTVHQSEYDCIRVITDHILCNDGSVEALHEKVAALIGN